MILIHQYLQNLININFEKGKLWRLKKKLPLQAFPYLQADMAYVGDVFLSVFLGVDCGDLPLLRWPGHIAEGVSRDVGIWMISLNLYLGFFENKQFRAFCRKYICYVLFQAKETDLGSLFGVISHTSRWIHDRSCALERCELRFTSERWKATGFWSQTLGHLSAKVGCFLFFLFFESLSGG